jgi:hypothetical protein
LFTRDEAQKILSDFAAPLRTADTKPGNFVMFKKSGEIGEVVETTNKGIKVKFDTGVADMTIPQAKRLLYKTKQQPIYEFPSEVLEAQWKRIVPPTANQAEIAELGNQFLKRGLAEASDISDARAKPLIDVILQKLPKEDFHQIFKDVMDKYDLKTPELAAMFLRGKAKEAGQTFKVLSDIQKQINKNLGKYLKNDPDARALLGDALDDVAKSSFLAEFFRRAPTLYQAMLVSQIQTADRNFLMAHVTLGIDAMDALMVGAYQKITGTGLKGKEFVPAKRRMIAMKESGKRILTVPLRVSKKYRAQQDKAFLDFINQFPFEKSAVLSTPIQDFVLPKTGVDGAIAQGVTFLNRAQDRFLRKVVFEQKIMESLEKFGVNKRRFEDLTSKDLAFFKKNPHLVSEASELALKITAAAQPKTAFSKWLVKGWQKFPSLSYALPFMRFITWSTEYMVNHSPGPLMYRLTTKAFHKKLRRVDNEEAAKLYAEAATGAMLFATAWMIRKSPYGGDKWYEIVYHTDKNGNKHSFDMRPLFPLSPYLFAAEATSNALRWHEKGSLGKYKDGTQLNSQDWLEGMTGLRRLSGSALAVVDIIRQLGSDNPDTAIKSLKKVGGQIARGYATPLRMLSDAYSLVDPQEAIPRSTKEQPFFGPMMDAMPKVRQNLPRLATMTRSEVPARRIHPAVSQATAIRVHEASPVEQEISRLGIYLNPRGPSDETNRKIMFHTADKFRAVGDKLVKTAGYKNMTNKQKEAALRKLASLAKKQGLEYLRMKGEISEEEMEKYMSDLEDRVVGKVIGGVVKPINFVTP